jgi:hypothetical protein
LNETVHPLLGDAFHRQSSRPLPAVSSRNETGFRLSKLACRPLGSAKLLLMLRGREIQVRIGRKTCHKDSDFILNSCRYRAGRTIDFLCLEGLIRMAVTLHANQLAYTASARMIALAIQNKVNGLGRLRTDERVV